MVTKSDSPPVWQHVIGIIGGMGPHAHVEFETLLLEATGKALGRAPEDQDYPPWIVSSMPATPDRTKALLEGAASPVDALVRSAERLSDADFAAIPCNSAHAFLKEVRSRVSIPLLDMIRVTVERAIDLVGKDGRVGVLAATGTLKAGLYRDWIRRIAPDARVLTLLDLGDGNALQERLTMVPIFGELRGKKRVGDSIKSGAFRDPATREKLAEPMREGARLLANAGAAVVLTACTEIPLALGRESIDGAPLLDPMAVAAENAIDIALGRKPLPS